MNETNMTLARDWEWQPIVGWLLTEKFDGCRAYWDGAQLWTRGGNVIPAPESFTSKLPAIPLDGELWAGRGCFTEARVAVQFGKWTPNMRFVVYDAPSATGTWEMRMQVAKLHLAGCEVAFAAEYQRIRSTWQMQQAFCQIKEAGGEGVMLRHPRAKGYIAGRTDKLLRVKDGGIF